MLNFQISVEEGTIGGYLSGVGSKPRPGIVLLQEIFGVNDAMRLAADNFAADGFIVLAPDLFAQISPAIELGYTEAERATAIDYWQRLDEARLRSDVAATVEALRLHPSCNGKVAAVGFCLGGKQAIVAAHAGLVDAAVSYYPVQVPTYPEMLRDLKCPVQVHVGDADTHIPTEAQTLLSDALADAPRHEYHVHPGAGHGFYNSVRAFGYDPVAADRSHRAAVDFIRTTIA